MNCNDIELGLRVKVVKLSDTVGIIVSPRHLDVRREGLTGTVKNGVPGHGGDVWYVQHDNSPDVGVYSFSELEPDQRKLS